MRIRAEMGYGLYINNNRRIAESQPAGNEELARTWAFLQHAFAINDDGKQKDPVLPSTLSNNSSSRLGAGILPILLPSRISCPSISSLLGQPIIPSSTEGVSSGPMVSTLADTSKCTPATFQVFISPQRAEALRLCGWFDTFSAVKTSHTDSTDKTTNENTSSSNGSSANGINGHSNKIPAINGLSHSTVPPEANVKFDPSNWSQLGFTSFEHALLEQTLRQLEERGEYEQAACLAVFHLDLPRALTSLSLGARSASSGDSSHDDNNSSLAASKDLGLVAMALSGYDGASRQKSNLEDGKDNEVRGISTESNFAPHTFRQSVSSFFLCSLLY